MSAQESQALIVMNKELQNKHKNDQRYTKKLKANIAATEQPETFAQLPTSLEIDNSIDTALATAEVGSTVIVDTRRDVMESLPHA